MGPAISGATSETEGVIRGGVVTQENSSSAGQPDDTANNSTTAHEDPARVGENGDLSAVEQWLQNELGSQLKGSALQLSQGQYERAKSLLGDDYSDALGKLVDVAGETDNAGGRTAEEQKERFNKTRTTQREYITKVRSFRETLAEYQEAKDTGNEARARQLARRLNQQAQRIQALSQQLAQNYTVLGNITQGSFEATIQTISNITGNVTETRQSIVAAEFIETRLRISRVSSTASFTEPARIHGRIQTANGSTPNGTVTLQIAGKHLSTGLTANGTFSVQFRPVTQPRGEQQITARYVPHPSSLYLGDTSNTTITVTSVTPTVTVTRSAAPLRFGHPTDVHGRVTVNGTGVPGLPIAVRVGTTRLGIVTTNATGHFQYTGRLPASIQPGTRPLAATIPLEGRAITQATTSHSVVVAETKTNLSITGDWNRSEITVTGRLTTTNGTPAPGQPIQIIANGTTLATTQTDSDGQYTAVLSANGQLSSKQSVTLTAVYKSPGTNLANATAQTDLHPPTQARNNSMMGGLLPWLAVGGLFLVIVVGGVYYWRQRDHTDSPSTPSDPATNDSTADPATDDTNAKSNKPPTPLDRAREALEANDSDSAIQHAYSAVRSHIESTATDSPTTPTNPVTHWEFYHTHKDTIPETLTFRELTQAYETAKYAPTDSTLDTAREAITAAKTVLNDTQPANTPPTDQQ